MTRPAMTNQVRPVEPVDTTRLFRPLHRELIGLLRGLDPKDWERPTRAGTWSVTQVAAHLLHGDLRKLSASPDGDHERTMPLGFAELVEMIETDNARGVEFLSDLSPRLLTDLLEVTGPWVATMFARLPPESPSATDVAWANEATSANWMDVGREFTEQWHHQMHIRDAVGAPGLTSRRWIKPILRLSVLALRRSYRPELAAPGTCVVLSVRGAWRHSWSMVRGRLSGSFWTGRQPNQTPSSRWTRRRLGDRSSTSARSPRREREQRSGATWHSRSRSCRRGR
jgi:uncharacterized protein (TIGR03083 family)